MVVGITKAGKSTLLKKLIGVNVLISNEKRATATKWVVNFHKSKIFILKIYRTVVCETKIENFEFQNLKMLQNACKDLNNAMNISKVSISVPSIESELELKFIDMPGLDDGILKDF